MEKVISEKKLRLKIFSYILVMGIVFSVSMLVFFWMGMKIQKKKTEKNAAMQPLTQIDLVKAKVADAFQQIEKFYVNEIDIMKHSSLLVKTLFNNIDPNSSYLDAKNIEENKLKPDLEGLDFVYTIDKGNVVVVAPIYEGVMYDAGFRSGDVILKIDDEDLSLKKYNEFELPVKLYGQIGSKVNFLVKKKKDSTISNIIVTRQKINSIDSVIGCMLDESTGYVKITFFGQNTGKEFGAMLGNLTRQGMNNLVLDLRSNPGGDVDEAFSVAEKLLKKGLLICAIKGKIDAYNHLVYSKGKETFENVNVIVLIDEGTAGGAEIVAGAIQDNDRAIVAGSKSFGKGIVKNTFSLQDGSKVALTVGKYYTPSGRSISRDSRKKSEDQAQLLENLKNIDYVRSDSISVGENIYHTISGRVVYGDGGIVPDFFIVQSQESSSYINSINFIIKNVAKSYTTQNLNLAKTDFDSFMKNFEVSNILIDQIRVGAKEYGIECDDEVFRSLKATIKTKLKAYVASLLWKEEPYFRLLIVNDIVVQKAMKILKENSVVSDSSQEGEE